MWGDRQKLAWRRGRNKKGSQQHVESEEWHFIHAALSFVSPRPRAISLPRRIPHYQGVKFSPRHFITRTFDRDASAEFHRLEILFALHNVSSPNFPRRLWKGGASLCRICQAARAKLIRSRLGAECASACLQFE